MVSGSKVRRRKERDRFSWRGVRERERVKESMSGVMEREGS